MLTFASDTSPARQKTRCAGLLPRWREGLDIDKAAAASLALFHVLPGKTYRVTINFDAHNKRHGFEYLRDELTRIFKKHQIPYYWFSFEFSKKRRLHCHGAANFSDLVDIGALELHIKRRFGNSDEARASHKGRNKLVHISVLTHDRREGKGPESWASYSLGDAMLTRAESGWSQTYYISRQLVKPAKAAYEWLRTPDIDRPPPGTSAVVDSPLSPV